MYIDTCLNDNRAFGGSELFVDLVPESCWFKNVRSHVSKSDWDRLRHIVYERAGNRCECCGAPKDPSQKRWIEAHERWSYDDTRRIQKLERLIALCTDCHQATHFGLANIRGLADKAIAHLMRVRRETEEEVIRHIEQAFELWEKRSDTSYILDISILEKAGVVILH